MLCVVDIDTADKVECANALCLLFEVAMPQAQREVKSLPDLYKSGIKYEFQDPRACAFRSPKDIYDRKVADCKQLVLYRMAQLRNSGVWVMPRIIWLAQKEKLVAHAQLRHPNGQETNKVQPLGDIEDPSYHLGMKAI